MDYRGHNITDWKADGSSKMWAGDNNAFGVTSTSHNFTRFIVFDYADVNLGDVSKGKWLQSCIKIRLCRPSNLEIARHEDSFNFFHPTQYRKIIWISFIYESISSLIRDFQWCLKCRKKILWYSLLFLETCRLETDRQVSSNSGPLKLIWSLRDRWLCHDHMLVEEPQARYALAYAFLNGT